MTEKLHPIEELNLSSNILGPLKRIFLTVGLDENIPGYREIVPAFSYLLQDTGHLPSNVGPFWELGRYWFEELKKCERTLSPTDLPHLDKNKSKFGVIRGIIFNPPPNIEEQHQLARQILIGVILVTNKVPHATPSNFDTQLSRTGNILHRSREEGSPEYNAVSMLPKEKIGTNPLLEIQKNSDYYKRILPHNKNASEFINNIRQFSNFLLQARLPVSRPTEPEEDLGQDLQSVEPLVSLFAEKFDDSTHPSSVLVEEPQADLSIREPQASDAAGPSSPAQPTSLAELDRQARRTNFLGRQWQPPTPWEFGSVSPIEWPMFAALLANLPQLAAPNGRGEISQALALVAALQAASSYPLDQVVKLTYGENGDIHPDGWWRRSVPPPENAFSPPPESDDFLATVSEFWLPLPSAVQAILANWPSPDPETKIESLLGLTDGPNELSNFRQNLGDLLRKKVSGRLRTDHLRTALRRKIHGETQCEVTTYCLVGEIERSIPPVALYYYSLSVEELVSVYNECVSALFSEHEA